MVSKTAQADIEDMWEQGLKPSVADIIQLNALGLIVENATRPTESMYYLRRCAWLGDVVLKQPLLAHEVWLAEANRCVSDDLLSQLAVRAFICCTEPENLPDATSKDAIKKAVEKFAHAIEGFTQAQIAAAVMYVTVGNDWRTNEYAPSSKNQEDKSYWHFGPEFCSAVGIVYNGIAIGLDISISEAMNLPRSTFHSIVERKLRYEDAIDKKKAFNDAEDDYFRALDAITKRLKETKDNG